MLVDRPGLALRLSITTVGFLVGRGLARTGYGSYSRVPLLFDHALLFTEMRELVGFDARRNIPSLPEEV